MELRIWYYDILHKIDMISTDLDYPEVLRREGHRPFWDTHQMDSWQVFDEEHVWKSVDKLWLCDFLYFKDMSQLSRTMQKYFAHESWETTRWILWEKRQASCASGATNRVTFPACHVGWFDGLNGGDNVIACMNHPAVGLPHDLMKPPWMVNIWFVYGYSKDPIWIW